MRSKIREWSVERDWIRYHTPRNIALAMVGEVGELCECFMWKGEVDRGIPQFSEAERTHLGEEISDVLIYLVSLADACKIDLPKAALDKMAKNSLKYPGPNKMKSEQPSVSPPSNICFLSGNCDPSIVLSNHLLTATKSDDSNYAKVHLGSPGVDRLEPNSSHSHSLYSFKLKYQRFGWVWIGWAPISSLTGKDVMRDGYFLYTANSNLFSKNDWGVGYSGSIRVEVNQVIESILDVNNRTIAFKIDGKDMGIAFTDIQTPTTLHPTLIFQNGIDSSWSVI
uniref:SPRY domain-containing protein n=1 Tax=Arcella intermedia TaxID=1963864 RepID=A0A6B2LCP5_9EUKA